MDVLKRMRRLVCRHEYGWSERRHAEVCYHCGRVRDAEDSQDAPAADRPPDERG